MVKMTFCWFFFLWLTVRTLRVSLVLFYWSIAHLKKYPGVLHCYPLPPGFYAYCRSLHENLTPFPRKNGGKECNHWVLHWPFQSQFIKYMFLYWILKEPQFARNPFLVNKIYLQHIIFMKNISLTDYIT